MWTRKELKDSAKNLMSKNYGKMLLVSFIVMVLTGSLFRAGYEVNSNFIMSDYEVVNNIESTGIGMTLLINFLPVICLGIDVLSVFLPVVILLGIAYNVFVANPISIGEMKFYIKNRKDDGELHHIFYSFNHNYLNVVKIMVIMYVKLFLWTLLLIVPGIIKAYEYSMIPFILAENPDISTEEAFALSKRMTDNEKFEMFVLDLSFLGWYFLGGLLCGIGVVLVSPYKQATQTELYFKLKEVKNISIEAQESIFSE